MSLQTLHEDLNKYEFKNKTKRENIIKKIKDILHLEELSSIYSDLLAFDVKDIAVELDDKTILNITNPRWNTEVYIITEKEESAIIFRELQPRYSRAPEINALTYSELSEFYHKLEPYKEIIEDKIEENIRKQFDFDKLIKTEG